MRHPDRTRWILALAVMLAVAVDGAVASAGTRRGGTEPRPETTLTRAPARGEQTTATTAILRFRSNLGRARFECSLDTSAWRRCRSPWRVAGLRSGRHRASVRAVVPSRGADPTPARRTWTVLGASGQDALRPRPSQPARLADEPAAAAGREAPDHAQIVADEAAWISTAQVPSAAGRPASGAIAIHPDKGSGTWRVLPYDANIAARGMLRGGAAYLPKVRAWMDWYIGHLNRPDRFGMHSTVYDWTVSTASWAETSTESYDSADSYAASFLALVKDYVTFGGDRTWVTANRSVIDAVGHVMTDPMLLAPDGLTYATPTWRARYAMDNAETLEGLEAAAWIASAVWEDEATSRWYGDHAAAMRAGYEGLWSGSMYSVAKHEHGVRDVASWSRWYPDVTAQVFPIRYGVVPAAGPRATSLYDSLNAAWPDWTSCSQDGEPFSEVGHAAAVRGDEVRVDRYLDGCRTAWWSRGRPWPYQVRHAGTIALTAATQF